MTKILSSKPIVDHAIVDLKHQCDVLRNKGVIPCLKVILVGENSASLVYTSNKKKFCDKIGADCEIVRLKENTSSEELVALLIKLGADKSVHGIIVQLPLPKHLNGLQVDTLIPPNKDVDGFHPLNLGSMLIGKSKSFLPCTPKAIINLLKYYQISISGKNAVIIGRSNIVGKPIGILLLQENATVSYCHSYTKDLSFFTRHADIVVAAIGKAKFLDNRFFDINKQATVIDVGMNRDNEGKLCGDVDYEKVFPIVSGITPVPGGIGPLTIIGLLQNLLQATQNSLI